MDEFFRGSASHENSTVHLHPAISLLRTMTITSHIAVIMIESDITPSTNSYFSVEFDSERDFPGYKNPNHPLNLQNEIISNVNNQYGFYSFNQQVLNQPVQRGPPLFTPIASSFNSSTGLHSNRCLINNGSRYMEPRDPRFINSYRGPYSIPQEHCTPITFENSAHNRNKYFKQDSGPPEDLLRIPPLDDMVHHLLDSIDDSHGSHELPHSSFTPQPMREDEAPANNFTSSLITFNRTIREMQTEALPSLTPSLILDPDFIKSEDRVQRKTKNKDRSSQGSASFKIEDKRQHGSHRSRSSSERSKPESRSRSEEKTFEVRTVRYSSPRPSRKRCCSRRSRSRDKTPARSRYFTWTPERKSYRSRSRSPSHRPPSRHYRRESPLHEPLPSISRRSPLHYSRNSRSPFRESPLCSPGRRSPFSRSPSRTSQFGRSPIRSQRTCGSSVRRSPFRNLPSFKLDEYDSPDRGQHRSRSRVRSPSSDSRSSSPTRHPGSRQNSSENWSRSSYDSIFSTNRAPAEVPPHSRLPSPPVGQSGQLLLGKASNGGFLLAGPNTSGIGNLIKISTGAPPALIPAHSADSVVETPTNQTLPSTAILPHRTGTGDPKGDLAVALDEATDEDEEKRKLRRLREDHLKKQDKLLHELFKLQAQQADSVTRQQWVKTAKEASRLQVLIIEKAKLQKVITCRIKLLEKLIAKCNEILNEDMAAVRTSQTALSNLTFFDPEHHWCPACDLVIPGKIDAFLLHLHSTQHNTNRMSLGVPSFPWHKQSAEIPSPAAAPSSSPPIQRAPFHGLPMLEPVKAWHCQLCGAWIGDITVARLHLSSNQHNAAYIKYIIDHPEWETNCAIKKQEALQRSADQIQQEKKRADEERQKKLHQQQLADSASAVELEDLSVAPTVSDGSLASNIRLNIRSVLPQKPVAQQPEVAGAQFNGETEPQMVNNEGSDLIETVDTAESTMVVDGSVIRSQQVLILDPVPNTIQEEPLEAVENSKTVNQSSQEQVNEATNESPKKCFEMVTKKPSEVAQKVVRGPIPELIPVTFLQPVPEPEAAFVAGPASTENREEIQVNSGQGSNETVVPIISSNSVSKFPLVEETSVMAEVRKSQIVSGETATMVEEFTLPIAKSASFLSKVQMLKNNRSIVTQSPMAALELGDFIVLNHEIKQEIIDDSTVLKSDE